MGIKGLETFLRERGLLPSCDYNKEKFMKDESGNTIDNQDDFCFRSFEMMPGYTFAIDGYGLVFYILDLAYKRYFRTILSKYQKGRHENGQDSSLLFENEDHFLFHLFPSMTPLSLVESLTNEILELLLMKYQINLQIYIDGHSKTSRAMNGEESMKEYTDNCRKERRKTKEENLKRFCIQKILPRSFKKKRKQNPDPDLFFNEFPSSKLALDQVLYSIKTFEIKLNELTHNLDLIHDSTTENYGNLTIIHCEEEADRSVALASAMDTSNRTFAVGNDSDFYLFGFAQNSPMWIMGNVRVQYVPLDYLLNHMLSEGSLKGFVITRQDIANALQLPSEEYLIEAGILVGNDYTNRFVDWRNSRQNKSDSRRNAMESTNLYKEGCLENYEYHKKIEFEDILRILVQETNDTNGCTYKIQSDNPEFQLAIDYTRDLYQFQNIDHYTCQQQNENTYGKHNNGEENKEDKWSTIKPLVESMDVEDHSWDTLRHQILAPFEAQSHNKNDKHSTKFYCAILSALDHIHYNSVNDDMILPTSIDWNRFSTMIELQKSISIVLRERINIGAYPQPYLNPSRLFNAIIVQHYLLKYDVERLDGIDSNCMNPMQLNVNVDDKDKIYVKKSETKKSLPIDEYEDVILKNISQNRVTIIQGETGCGKSSRVPLMLLNAPPPDTSSNIVKLFICQPRRIAAKSLFDRIRTSEPQYKDQIGLRLGHGVRENETEITRAWFVTTGYLVKLLANNPEYFDSFTHIIIDEVHERSVDTDILCLLCRRLLSSHPTVRLVLMSATIVADMYQRYFDIIQPPIFVGTRCHSIQYFYLDDISNHLNLGPAEEKLVNDVSKDCLKMKIDVAPKSRFIENLCQLAFQVALSVATRGSSVLIFVSGMADIITITELFEDLVTNTTYTCIGIHSEIPFEEQLQAFQSPEKEEIKIIVATNAAESSLTLPDVDHVICLGICKQISYDNMRHRQILCPRYICQSSAKQRAGRTGRVRDGYVYRLYPQKMYESMLEFEEGEILRTPLDSIILNLRTIVGDESVIHTLSECLEVPNMSNIESSLTNLYKLNFIDEPNEFFKITPSGKFVVGLGIDLTLGAFIWYAVLFDLTAEAVDIAAIVSVQKSPWLIPNALLQDSETYNRIVTTTFTSKSYFDSRLYSEPFAIMNLIWEWSKCKNHNAFCHMHGIHQGRLKHVITTRNSIRTRVASALNLKVGNLYVQQPPCSMSFEALTILRILQVWVFQDSIIKLVHKPSLNIQNLDNDKFAIELSGDTVSDAHFQQILDKEKHQYHLENIENISFHGQFRYEKCSGYCLPIEYVDFEARLISLCLEKDFSKILYTDGVQIFIYSLSPVVTDMDLPFEDESSVLLFSMGSNVLRRGWRERECGAWKCHRSDFDENENKALRVDKVSSTGLTQKKVTQYFKQLKKMMRLNCQEKGTNILCLKLSGEGAKGMTQFQLNTYGQCYYVPTIRILSDLFGTLPERINLSKIERNLSQKIVFECSPTEERNISVRQQSDSPEGARLIFALANGYRSKPIIRLKNYSDDSHISHDESSTHIEIIPKDARMNDRWKQFFSAHNVMVDPTSLPASVIPPDDTEVYACCANILELIGGSIRVDCLTLLPSDPIFLALVMRCIGVYLPTDQGTMSGFEELLFGADRFRAQLKNKGQELPTFSPTLKESLCALFSHILCNEESSQNHVNNDILSEDKLFSNDNSEMLQNRNCCPSFDEESISDEKLYVPTHQMSSILEKYSFSYLIQCPNAQNGFFSSRETVNDKGEEQNERASKSKNNYARQYHCIMCSLAPVTEKKQIESHIIRYHSEVLNDEKKILREQ